MKTNEITVAFEQTDDEVDIIVITVGKSRRTFNASMIDPAHRNWFAGQLKSTLELIVKQVESTTTKHIRDTITNVLGIT